ncbi:MAG: fructose-1,6-bisphosphatase [Ardenticatenaceae bacterium]|nr:fructose-1,6-bisphosphatase [Ardenticatenaceae bacterium]
MDVSPAQLKYLKLLAQHYPTIQAASTEIINLSAKLNLPKGTEHFISDIHGEYEAFVHVLKNSSGSIKRRIDEIFSNSLTERERRDLATLIYYPRRKLPLLLQQVEDQTEWFRLSLFRLIKVCRAVSSKYSRAYVRAALPENYADIIEELLYQQENDYNRQAYYESIIATIIDIGQSAAFIVALAEIIQELAIDRLHIIGDIYDRGPGAHIILDELVQHPAIDIQWGNHDMLWMGAAAGNTACMANVIRISLRYANMETLENGYAISMLPLASFALDVYRDDPCDLFRPKVTGNDEFTDNEIMLMARMQKAIAIIQFKLEGQIIRRRPHYDMQDRLLLDKIDYEKGTIHLNGQDYPLLDTHFPTIDPANPYALTPAEEYVVNRLHLSFTNSSKLQQHVRFLFSKGSMYLVHNGNLLYHGCIAMNEDGSFMALRLHGQEYAGKIYMDRVERLARQGYFATDPEQKQYGLDAIWYLWSGGRSPLFGKDKMATFERYFLTEKETHRENKNPYYELRDKKKTANKILEEFGLEPETAHIINGHVPVEVKHGESPVKAGGKLLVIDGGLSKAYQTKTGIAGYTLIYNSYGLLLASHEPFESTQKAIEEGIDIHSKTEILEQNRNRIYVKDTDLGQEIKKRIDELKSLLDAYRVGLIKENIDS